MTWAGSPLNRLLISIIAAVTLGFVLITLPVITFRQYGVQDLDHAHSLRWERLGEPEGLQIVRTQNPFILLEILAADLAAAFLAYLAFKRRVR